jgi:hypothetical protein
MRALNGVLVQKRDGGLDELQVRAEKQWEAGGSRLAHCRFERGGRGRTQRRWYFVGLRQLPFANNLNHENVYVR